MNNQRVRIGTAKRVHYAERVELSQTMLEEHGLICYWATSKCGKWAGEAYHTQDQVTCNGCLNKQK